MGQIRWFVCAWILVTLSGLALTVAGEEPTEVIAPGQKNVDFLAAGGTVDSFCLAPVLAVVTARGIGFDSLIARDFAAPETAQIRPANASALELSPDGFENRGGGVYRLVIAPVDGAWAAGQYQVGLRLDSWDGVKAEWVLVPITVTAIPSCFVQWRVEDGGNGHWYKAVVNTENLDWTEAEGVAVNEGGHLASITTADENEFVFGLINAPEFFSGWGGNGSGPAIGGIRKNLPDPAAGWSWVTAEPWGYTSWHEGQPDYSNENRLQFWSGSQGIPEASWNNLSATDRNLGGFIIELEDVVTRPR